MNDKIFVLDTNVLIHNPRAMFSFEDNRVVIPITVIEEVDNFKKSVDEKGRNARQIGRYLDELREKGSLRNGVKTKNGGAIQVVLSRKVSDTTNDVLITDVNDNLIIGTALFIHEKYPEKEVILISKDANVRIKADAVGLKAANFQTDKINFSDLGLSLNPGYTINEISIPKKSKETQIIEGETDQIVAQLTDILKNKIKVS